MLNRKTINSVLIITLSNIGDAILTTPVLDVLFRQLPQAKIDVLAAPRTAALFANHKAVRETIIYNKHTSFFKKISLVKKLRRKHYDLVVDLKNSVFPLLLGSHYRTPLFYKKKRGISMKETHLEKIKSLGFDIRNAKFFIDINEESSIFAKQTLKDIEQKNKKYIIAISVGARSHIKRWPLKNFLEISKELESRDDVFLIFVGDQADKPLVREVLSGIDKNYLDLSGKTSLLELAAILKGCDFLLCNDSAIMHMASAVETPLIALFGPTDHRKYGPKGKNSILIHKDIKCAPCQKAQCLYNHECLDSISSQEVMNKIKVMIENLKK